MAAALASSAIKPERTHDGGGNPALPQNKEVELKWRLNRAPAFLADKATTTTQLPHWHISQTYLGGEWETCPVLLQLLQHKNVVVPCWAAIKEVRLRQRTSAGGLNPITQHILTLKSDGTLERDEYEVSDLRVEEVEALLATLPQIGSTIWKRRFAVPLLVVEKLEEDEKELILEVDVFEAPSTLVGLVLVELEFNPDLHGGVDAINLARLQRLAIDTLKDREEGATTNASSASVTSVAPLEWQDVTNDRNYKNRQLATHTSSAFLSAS